MAILNMRNLPDDVHSALRIKVAEAGLSMEAEARRILAEACGENKEACCGERTANDGADVIWQAEANACN